MQEVKKLDALSIYKNDVLAGTLKRTETGSAFDFDKAFLESSETYLSYRIRKSEASLVTSGVNLHQFFAGLLPEGLRLKALVKNIKTSEDDLFTLFAASGFNCIGDVHVKNSENTIEKNVPKLSGINFLEYFDVLTKDNSYADGENTISGVQEKISASMISFPLNIAREKHAYILKLNPKDKPNLVENELYSLTLAKKCGIDVNKVKVVVDKDKNKGLLVQRFDRYYDDNSSKIRMIHQEDACQFLNKYPADKYRLSLNEIAQGIEEIATAPKIEIFTVLRLYVFSYLIGNGDLHAKNISLRTDSKTGNIELTSAYDIISTIIYGDQKMAIKIDGRDDNITRKTVLDFASRFGLSDKIITRMIDDLIEKVSNHKKILFQMQIKDKQKVFLENTIKKRINDLASVSFLQ